MFRFSLLSFLLGCLVGTTGIQLLITLLNKLLDL